MERSRKSWIIGAATSSLSSSRKWPVSSRWNSADGRSPDRGGHQRPGRPESFWPQMISVGGWWSRKKAWNSGYSVTLLP